MALLCAIAFLLALPQQSEAAVTLLKPPNNLGLVGYWSFNEGTDTIATDFSGFRNHGTLTDNGNGLPTWISGKRGKALNFAPSGSEPPFVDVGNGMSLQITGSTTIAAWVKFDSFQAGAVDDSIVAKTGDGTEIAYSFKGTEDCGAQTLAFFISGNTDGSLSAFRCSATTLQANTWYHLLGVYNGTGQNVDVYVNGVLDNGSLNGTPPAAIFSSRS